MQSIRNFFQTLTVHPGRSLLFFCGFSAILWTLQCAVLQNVLPLDVIETIVWGAQGQFGHLKHPPLSGWIGYGVSRLSGYSDWSMYLLAQMCLICGVFYVYRLAKEFLPERSAAAAALILYVLPYYNPSSMKFCSHFLELALEPAMAFYFCRGLKTNQWKYWIMLGVASALGILSKYSSAMLLLAFFIYMLFSGKENRKYFMKPGPYAAALVCVLLLLPHLHWLYTHDFPCIRHLGVRMDSGKPKFLPLQAVLTMIMPYALEIAILAAALFSPKQTPESHKPDKDCLKFVLPCALIPAGILTGITFIGKDIVLMWFSFLASFTGIVTVASFPRAVTETGYKRLYLLICLLTSVIFIATTVDLLVRPIMRCHTYPKEIISVSEEFFRQNSGGQEIPAIIGERWFGGIIEHYTASRPPSSPLNDPVNLELIRRRVWERGALVENRKRKNVEQFLKTHGVDTAPKRIIIKYSTLTGREDDQEYYLGYLPPGTLKPVNDQNDSIKEQNNVNH